MELYSQDLTGVQQAATGLEVGLGHLMCNRQYDSCHAQCKILLQSSVFDEVPKSVRPASVQRFVLL